MRGEPFVISTDSNKRVRIMVQMFRFDNFDFDCWHDYLHTTTVKKEKKKQKQKGKKGRVSTPLPLSKRKKKIPESLTNLTKPSWKTHINREFLLKKKNKGFFWCFSKNEHP